jgi:GH25 family lysozyme M1 (1,4-beta-N-acetylmuramidase)
MIALNGIDISNLQGNVNMNQVKSAGIGFIVAKATEGSTFVDKYYNQNIANAKAAGLLAGAYHFAKFTDISTATNEANFFIANCKGANPDFVVLDFEQCGIFGDMTNACLAFLDIISKVAPAVIYCNPSYISSYLNSNITKYPLWIAHYNTKTPSTPLWGTYDIWQYSDSGQVSGVSSNVDLDIMTDDFYNLLKAGGKKKVNSVVVYNYGADMHSAEILADYLNCPTISNSRKFDYSCVQNVYAVGGNAKQYTSYVTKLISGADEFGTNQAVLNFISNGGK